MFDSANTGKWWDKGITLVEGCTKVSKACDNCWSLSMENRFRKRDKSVKFHGERLEKIRSRKKPTAYAIWNDLFHEEVTFDQIDLFMDAASDMYRHTFLVLTKRPARALEYFTYCANRIKDAGFDSIPSQSDNIFDYYDPMPNLWIGVTAEDQRTANERIPILKNIPAKYRFISFEPLLENVFIYVHNLKGKIHWMIAGPETGLKKRKCNYEWIDSLFFQSRSIHSLFYDKGDILGVGIREFPRNVQ